MKVNATSRRTDDSPKSLREINAFIAPRRLTLAPAPI